MRWFLTICVLVTGLHCSPDARADDIAALRTRADQGDVTAQFDLSVVYITGKGVAQNYKQAVVWSRKAADQGNATAPTSLAGMYDTGQGVVQDYGTALKWYGLAADQGDAGVCRKVGSTNGKRSRLAWIRKARAC